MPDRQENDDAAGDGRKGRVNWNDPAIPWGDSPPLPRWPLVLAALVWVAWIGFLVTMTVVASRSTPA